MRIGQTIAKRGNIDSPSPSRTVEGADTFTRPKTIFTVARKTLPGFTVSNVPLLAPAAAASIQTQAAPPPNRTGLPDRLKVGIEALSGMAMDDVRVHYNSPKPAAIRALAHAEGSEIHVAPGQEQHLPHEAWHVVQQKQGRVRAVKRVAGFAFNDDAGLEREADVLGARARQGVSGKPPSPARAAKGVPTAAIQAVLKTEHVNAPGNHQLSPAKQTEIHEQFREKVRKNLQYLAPKGWIVSVGDDGKVDMQEAESSLPKGSVEEPRDHAGYRLLRDIIKNKDRTITIRGAEERNDTPAPKTLPDEKKHSGESRDSVVILPDENQFKSPTYTGGAYRRPGIQEGGRADSPPWIRPALDWIILGHELIHAHHNMHGTDIPLEDTTPHEYEYRAPYRPDVTRVQETIPVEESQTVGLNGGSLLTENQLRQEVGLKHHFPVASRLAYYPTHETLKQNLEEMPKDEKDERNGLNTQQREERKALEEEERKARNLKSPPRPPGSLPPPPLPRT